MPPEKAAGPSVADATRAYIDEHPSIRSALADDLLNFALLARKILSERELRNEEAVTIACRRYQRGIAHAPAELARVREIVEGSRLEVHSRVAIVRVTDDWELLDRLLSVGRDMLPAPPRRRLFQLYEGTQAVTILCEEDFLTTLLPIIPEENLLGVERGLATLAFRSDPAVAETPGVVAYVVDALARRGINCRETVSVYTDSIFVFGNADVIEAYQLLTSLLGGGGGPDRVDPLPHESRGQQS
ncbi:MAG: hypothetical protein ACHQ2Y_03105 [Candidatus Lutacidiplasmatales archaeon]